MGMHAAPAKLLGKVPTYYVTDTIQENAGGGNISIMNYARINGVFVPQFRCIIASCRGLVVARSITDFAEEIFKAEQLRLPSEKVH